MVNRRPQGYLDNDCEANIDENMCKLIDAINEGGGGGSDKPAVTKVEMSCTADGVTTTLQLDNKKKLTGGYGISPFMPFYLNTLGYSLEGRDSWGNPVNSSFFDVYLKTIPRYINANELVAGTTSNALTLVWDKYSNPSWFEANKYVKTSFALAPLKIFGGYDYETNTRPIFTLSTTQIQNYVRTDTFPDAQEGEQYYKVGGYRNEYYVFSVSDVSEDAWDKPIYLVLTLQQSNPNYSSTVNEQIYDAPCIVKVCDKGGELENNDFVVKVQNTAGYGDFIVTKMPVENKIVHDASKLEEVVQDGLLPIYGGAIDDTVKPVEPQTLCVIKNNISDGQQANARIHVKGLALGVNLSFDPNNGDVVPTSMDTYASGVQFKIQMYIETNSYRDNSENQFDYQYLQNDKFDLYNQWYNEQ